MTPIFFTDSGGGGSGFIGRYLGKLLKARGHETILLSRSTQPGGITWSELYKNGLPNDVDAVVNLAGHNLMDITKRWDSSFQQTLRDSRIHTTEKLAELINAAESPPSVFVSSSAIGFYKPSETVEYTEDSEGGDFDFMSTLCRDWEQAAKLAPDTKCRHVTVRIGLALGHGGGTVQKLLLPFFLGLGGPIGSGKQWFPWVHVYDVAGIIEHSIVNEHVTGILNAVAPTSNTNAEFSKAFAGEFWRPAFIPVPAFALQMIYGPVRASAMLEGQKVIPKRTLESGYKYMFPDLKTSCEQFCWLYLRHDDPPT